jgi:hypothetical protein
VQGVKRKDNGKIHIFQRYALCAMPYAL